MKIQDISFASSMRSRRNNNDPWHRHMKRTRQIENQAIRHETFRYYRNTLQISTLVVGLLLTGASSIGLSKVGIHGLEKNVAPSACIGMGSAITTLEGMVWWLSRKKRK